MSSAVIISKFTARDGYSGVVKKMQQTTGTFVQKAKIGFQQLQRNVIRLNSQLSSFNNKVSKVFKATAATISIGAALATRSLWNFIIQTAKAGDEAAKTSRRIGITAATLQELKFAADRQGVSGEETVKALEKLNKNVGDLKSNTGSLYTILKKSNPELLKQLQAAESNEKAFNIVTKAVNKLPNQLEKASLAQAAFGRSGLKMLTVMEDGIDGIEKLREEARKYGGVISNEAAAKAEAFIDAQTNMNFALFGLKTTIGMELMPIVQGYIEKITDWAVANKELIKTKVSEYVKKFVEKLKSLYETSKKVFNFISENKDTIIQLAKTFLILITVLKMFTTIMAVVNVVMAASPITWIVLGIIALIAAIVLLIMKWKEIAAAIDRFINKSKLLKTVTYPLQAIWDILSGITGVFKAFSADGFVAGIKQIGKSILKLILFPVQAILEGLAAIGIAEGAAAKLTEFRASLDYQEKKIEPPAVNTQATVGISEDAAAKLAKLAESRASLVGIAEGAAAKLAKLAEFRASLDYQEKEVETTAVNTQATVEQVKTERFETNQLMPVNLRITDDTGRAKMDEIPKGVYVVLNNTSGNF